MTQCGPGAVRALNFRQIAVTPDGVGVVMGDLRMTNSRNPRHFDTVEGRGNFLTHSKIHYELPKNTLKIHYELPKTL